MFPISAGTSSAALTESKPGVSRTELKFQSSGLTGPLEMEIDNHELRSYESIARELGISQKRVRDIEQRALTKLRKALEKQGVYSSEVEHAPCPAR
jgi:DNA-directed RNA polymerase specialized sigma24 family protein